MKLSLIAVLALCFLSCSSDLKTAEFYSDVKSYSVSKTERITIQKAIKVNEKGDFENSKSEHVFRKLDTTQLWLYKPLRIDSQPQYLTLSLTYFSYAKPYLIDSDGGIVELEQLSSNQYFPHENIFYRHPVWKIPATESPGELYLELMNNSGRVRLEFYMETQNEFLERIQTEYLIFGAIVISLLIIAAVLTFFSVSRKRYSILFYVVYIMCMVIEFLAGKGLGVQFLWSDNPFLVSSIRSCIQTIAVFNIALFYYSFYPYSKEELVYKRIFKWCAFVTIPFLLIYVYKYFVPSLERFYLYVWISMKVIIVVFLFCHIQMARKGKLPVFLVVGFMLPLLAMLVSQNTNPTVTVSAFEIKVISNIYYVFLLVEILAFTYYIFSTILIAQRNFVKLKKANEQLKQTFNKTILKNQEKERESLLSELHDTLGGYIVALKLRLKDAEDESIGELLNSLTAEYRYLLNNLYTPKINSANFLDNLAAYLRTMNSIGKAEITHKFELASISLPSETCTHLYRSLSEIVTNSLKHSRASKIQIFVFQGEENLKLKAIDNGIGFVKEQKDRKNHGIKSIENRIQKVRGNIQIESDNKGTEITITIPIIKR